MRLLWAAICTAAILGAGCQASYKSAAGGSTSPDGFGKGVSRSLVFADEGLLLSKLPLVALFGLASVGTVDRYNQTTKTWTTDDKIITETTTTATVNAERGAAVQKGIDSTLNAGRLGGRSGGLAARLEIAGESLGGDTRGWQYDMGFNYRRATSLGGIGVLFRSYVGLGYGNFSINNRAMTRMDRGPVLFGDGEYGFGGIYGRAGLALVKPPEKSVLKLAALEGYAMLSANMRGASYAGLGVRLQWSLFFIEGEMQHGGTSADDRSYVLNSGLGFF